MTALPPKLLFPLRALIVAAAVALTACGSDSPQSLLESGKTALAKRDPKTAVIQFKAALQKDPALLDARVLLGQALLDSGDPAGAILELNKALDQKAPAVKVVPALARAILLTGDYRKVTSLYGELNLEEPEAQASLKSSVASAWGALGDRPKTEAAVAAALAASPDFPAAAILQARLLAGSRNFDGALARIDKLLQKDEKQYEAWLLKGEILDFSKNDKAGAEAAFRKALEGQPAYIPGHVAIIGLKIRNRDLPGAKAQVAEMKKALPTHPSAVFVDAQIAFVNNETARARELVLPLLKAAPEHTGVLQLAGSIEGQLGSLFLAESHFAKALQIDPKLAFARRGLARIYSLQGQPERALATLKPLLDNPVEPGAAEAFTLAGDAELRRNQPDQATEYFKLAAKYAPDDVRVRTAVALTQLRQGDPTAVFAELEKIGATTTETVAEQALFAARLARRDFAGALKALDAIDKKAPNNARFAAQRGTVYVAQRDYKKARESYEQTLKLDPNYYEAVAQLAAIDLIDRKPDAAAERLASALKADNRNYLAAVALADLRQRQDAPVADVRKLYGDAIAASPQQALLRLRLIDYLLRKRQYKDALVAAQEAAAALPSDPVVLDAVGRAQMEAGDVEQAVATFRKLAGSSANPAAAYVRLGDIFRISGKREQSETAFRKAIELDPDFLPAHKGLVDLLLASKRAADVPKYLQQLQRDRPDKPVGYVLEAGYHARNRDVPAAVAAYKRGLAKTSDNSIARELYKLYIASGQRAEGDKFAADWLKAHPDDGAMDFQVAVTMIDAGELEAAEARLNRVVSRFPGNALAVNNLAWVMATRNRPGAVAMAQRALDLSPGNPGVLDTLALAFAAEKQPDKALETQKRAIELAPGDDNLRLSLARIAVLAGDKALARTELQRLQGLGKGFPKQEEVTRLLKQL